MDIFKDWNGPTSTTVGFVLLGFTLFLIVLLCFLIVLFCRKSRSPDKSILLSKMDKSCSNNAFDVTDETAPRRIEQRRQRRQRALFCEDTKADVTAKRLDRSMGNALAVEQLLTKSFVFDTNLLRRPDAEVVIVAAKRDYV